MSAKLMSTLSRPCLWHAYSRTGYKHLKGTWISSSATFSTSRMAFADLHYTKKHEWVTIDGNVGTVGISDYAQEALGDVAYVELPEVGTEVNKDVESVKAVSEIFSPVSGKITELNMELESKPKLINDSCYENGWIFKLELKNPAEIGSLMDKKAYEEYLKTVAH